MSNQTQLFKMVISNDYDGLTKFIHMGKKLELINQLKSGNSLISKAIEYRSLECFDILLNYPNLEIWKYRNSQNGLGTAIEYYCTGQNEKNKYYINRMIQHPLFVTSEEIFCNLTNETVCQELFTILFDKMPKTKDTIQNLVNRTVCFKSHHMFKYIVNWLESNQPEYYNTPEKRQTFYQFILSSAASNNNIDVFETLESIGVNILQVIDQRTHNNTQYVPTLFHIIRRELIDYRSNQTVSEILVNYFYNRYAELSQDELNKIPNINNLNKLIDIMGTGYCNKSKTNNFVIQCYEMMLNLPIIWKDPEIFFTQHINNILGHRWSSYYGNDENQYRSNVRVMELLITKFNPRKDCLENLVFNFPKDTKLRDLITKFVSYLKYREFVFTPAQKSVITNVLNKNMTQENLEIEYNKFIIEEQTYKNSQETKAQKTKKTKKTSVKNLEV